MEGQIYIAVGHNIVLGVRTGGVSTLYALRADNGVTTWSQQVDSVAYQSLDGGPTPAVLTADAGRVFVNETDDRIHALRAADGVEVWSAAGGVGTIGVGAGVLYQRGPVEQLSIMALRESDGAELWAHSFVSVHGLAVEGDHLVAVTMSSAVPGSLEDLTAYLTGISASDGKIRWQHRIGSTAPMPVVSYGVVYFTDGFSLDAVDSSDGHALWQEHVPDWTGSMFNAAAIAPRGNIVFVVTSAYIGEDPLFDPATCGCLPPDKVYALDAQHGAAYWQYRLPPPWSAGDDLQLALN
jgi:outer membrane protein assembly factor BamB